MTGAELIAEERRRQQEKLGWTQEHDNRKQDDELVHAAICYAMPEGLRRTKFWFPWPWDLSWWKPESRIRDLTKAGALIAAELDRLLSKQAAREKYETERAAAIVKAAEEQAERAAAAVAAATDVTVRVEPDPAPHTHEGETPAWSIEVPVTEHPDGSIEIAPLDEATQIFPEKKKDKKKWGWA